MMLVYFSGPSVSRVSLLFLSSGPHYKAAYATIRIKWVEFGFRQRKRNNMADKTNNHSGGLTAIGFLWRFIAALVLVFLTYNPSGQSAYHWISSAIAESAFGPLHLLLIGVLLIGWAVYWIATWRALGTLGVALAGLVLSAIIWLLIDIGLLSLDSVSAVTWVSLVGLSIVLAVGVSWSHVWRRLTGQLNVEDVDD
jgi:hypothetical protein